MTNDIVLIPSKQEIIAFTADTHARLNIINDFKSRKSRGTLSAYESDLRLFAAFLGKEEVEFFDGVIDLTIDIEAWRYITHGLVSAFVKWQLNESYSISSIHRQLGTIKLWARLVQESGGMTEDEYLRILKIKRYRPDEADNLDRKRLTTRRKGSKKAEHTVVTEDQVRRLKQQPNTPQGRRDRLIITLLADHGLRVGELAGLEVDDIDLEEGIFRFRRPKVHKRARHKMTSDTLIIMHRWMSIDALSSGALLRGSLKSGELSTGGMGTNSIRDRVTMLGEQIGIRGLHPHSFRHHYTTFWSKRVDITQLQRAGGWNRIETLQGYIEESEVDNEGMY